MADNETVVVTSDLYMRRPGILDPADEEILRHASRVVSVPEMFELMSSGELNDDGPVGPPPPGLVQLKPEDVQRLGVRTGEFYIRMMDSLHHTLSASMAAKIRKLRCEKRYSWRAVGSEFLRRATETLSLTPAQIGVDSSDRLQILGMALCESSARLLDEDPYAMPWNDGP